MAKQDLTPNLPLLGLDEIDDVYTIGGTGAIIGDPAFRGVSPIIDSDSLTAMGGGYVDSFEFEYDYENRLIRIIYPDSGSTEFAYDALGRRLKTIEKDLLGAITDETRYVYDGLDLIAELDGSNTVIASYTHGPGIDDPLIMRYNGQDYFYHKNHLGSVMAITDDSQAVVKEYEYDAFGNILLDSGPLDHNAFTYTAREYHPRSGLYYYRARFYDPVIGRFITQDPIGILGGVNLYGYVANVPTAFFDPFGLTPKEVALYAVSQFSHKSDWTGKWRCNEFVAAAFIFGDPDETNYPRVLRNDGYSLPVVADLADPNFAPSQLEYLPIEKVQMGDIIVWYDKSLNIHHSAIYIGNGRVVYQHMEEGIADNTVAGVNGQFRERRGWKGKPIVRRARRY